MAFCVCSWYNSYIMLRLQKSCYLPGTKCDKVTYVWRFSFSDVKYRNTYHELKNRQLQSIWKVSRSVFRNEKKRGLDTFFFVLIRCRQSFEEGELTDGWRDSWNGDGDTKHFHCGCRSMSVQSTSTSSSLSSAVVEFSSWHNCSMSQTLKKILTILHQIHNCKRQALGRAQWIRNDTR